MLCPMTRTTLFFNVIFLGHNISRIALRYAMDKIAADIVLCGTARVKELEENILNAKTPLNEEETKTMNDILDMLKDSFKIIQCNLFIIYSF